MQFDPSTARLVEPVSQFDPTTAVPVQGPSTRQILSATSLVAPDVATEAERLAKRYGTTTQSVLADLPTFKRQEEIDRAETALNRSPALSAVVHQDPYKAPQVRDDLVPLSTLAEMVESFKRGLAATRRGSDTGNIVEAVEVLSLIGRIERGELATDVDLAKASRYGSMFAGVGRTPENLSRMRAVMQQRIADNVADYANRTREIEASPPSPELARFQSQAQLGPAISALGQAPVRIATQVMTESLGALLPALPIIAAGGIAGGPFGLAATTGLSSASIEYLNTLPDIFRELKVDINDIAALERSIRTPEFFEKNRQAMIKAGVIGVFDAATAGLAGVRLATRPAANVAAQVGVQMAGGAAGEATGSVASGQEVSAAAVLSEMIGEVPGAMIDLGTQALRKASEMAGQAQEANATAETLQAALQTAAESKLRQRSPEEFRAVLEQMGRDADGTPTQIYVDGQVLNQLAPDVRQLLPQAVQEQIQRAAEIGDTVAIPVADVLTVAPGTALEQVLVENARLRPDAMTQAEARAAGDQAAQYLQQEAERVIQQATDQAAARASQDAVKTEVKRQLTATGRFRDAVNEGYATWAAAFYTAYGSRMGMTAEQFYQRYPLRVLGAAPGQQTGVLNAPRLGRLDGLEGFHFSKQDRPVITTAAFGTGLEGSSREQYLNAADQRLRKRSYFYVDKGTGINPEAGVGGRGQRVNLDNVYDADADPLRLKTGRDQLGFESAVLDAGFSGYLTRMEGSQSGQVIMLGDQTFQAEVLGPLGRTQGRPVPPPMRRPASGRDVVADALRARRDLPAGELTRERWGQILQRLAPTEYEALAAAGVFEGEGRFYKDGLIREFESRTQAPTYEQAAVALQSTIEQAGGTVEDVMQVDQLIDSKDIPTITLQDLVGKAIFPTIADRTAAAALYTGIDSSTTVAIPLLGGPFFPLRESNVQAGVVWANRGKGVIAQKAAKLKEGANYMMVLMGDANMHQSNSTVAAAFMATLEAYSRDGRISRKNIDALGNLVRQAPSNDPKVKEYLEGFPGFDNASIMHVYMDGMSFNARKRVLELMASKEALALGAPPMQKILDATREPSLAGHRWGDGVLLVEVDQTNPQVELGTEGTTAHPDFPVGVRGRVVGKLNAPINWELLWQDWLAENQDLDSPRRAFELAKPIVTVTQDLVDRIGPIEQANIDGARQARLAADFAAGNWRTSDNPVNKGGVSPQAFLDALALSDAGPTLSGYTLDQIKAGIKDGTKKIYQLGDGQIYFLLETRADGTKYLASVVNNEAGARGIGAPAIVLKALQEGATDLDCFAVKSSKYPQGFLPALYSAFGFEVTERYAFDPKYFKPELPKKQRDRALADAVKFWQTTTPGFDPSVDMPDAVEMKWKGTDADREGIVERYLRGGLEGLLAGRARADVEAAEAELSAPPGEPTGPAAGADVGGAARDQGARAGALVASRARGTVQGIAELSDNELANLGLSTADRDAVRQALGLPSAAPEAQPQVFEQTVAQGRIRRTVDELVAAAESQKDWKTWYARHEQVLSELFGNDSDLFQKILSATSQATGVKGNVTLALKAYDQLLSGQPFTGYLPAVIKNLERIRNEEALAGAKISQYGKANEGDADAIAVDRHIAMLFFNTKTPSAKQIASAKQRIRKIADRLGWEPRQVQAALWAFNQVRLGTDPSKVESYDKILENRADFIAELRARHGRGAGGGVQAGGDVVQGGAGRLEQGARGTFNPATLELVLNPNADLSTWFHETGHFFLEVLADVASQPGAPAQIAEDYNKVLAWFGVTPEQWAGFSLDQKRPYHERWAESIEQYVMEGKAPSVELAPVMRRFSAWLKSVYQSIKQFLAGRGVVQPGGQTLEQGAQTETPEFKRWFGDSKVVDAEGKPLVVYHGTTADFSVFDTERTALMGGGSWFSAEPMGEFSEGEGGNVMPVYLSLKNPKRFVGLSDFRKDKLIADGFDGVIVESPFSGKITAAVAFRPEQIKSAIGNAGTFDATNPSILAQGDQPAGSGIQLNDDIRRVMDRMLATDEQIQQANEVAGLMPDEQADGEAAERLQKRSIADLKWAVRARDKVIAKLKREAREIEKQTRAEVTAEVDQRPEVLAKAAIEKVQKDYEADPFSADMNIAAIADSFPEAGWTSVDAMYRAIELFGDKQQAIDGIVERRMLEEHGDLIDERAITEAANEAVHNEARARSLATELRTQQEMLNERADTGQVNARGARMTVNVLVEAAKQFGANVIARTPLKDLKATAWKHTAAERRAGKRWQEATMAGDTQAAVQAKQDQMLNNAAAKAALDATAESKKILEFFARVTKGNDEKTVEKGRDPDIVNAARAVLAAYGVQTPASKGAAEYLAVVQRNDPDTYAALEPVMAAALQNAQPLGALTFEELQGLQESIEAMWFKAKESREMEVDGRRVELDQVEDEVYGRLEEIGIPDRIPGEGRGVTAGEARIRKLRELRLNLTRVEQWAEAMDGKAQGTLWRYVFLPIKAAADRVRARRVEVFRALDAATKAVAPSIQVGRIEAPEIGYVFGEEAEHNGVGLAELIPALLNVGNESNRRKLLLGRGWATENADGTLDTTRWDAFINRLHNTGVLTKAHWDYVQTWWDALESLKKPAQEAHRQVYGRYFAEVTAEPVVTPFGTYRGGYYPAQVDTRLVTDMAIKKLAEAENENMSYAFPSVNRGFTKSRVEAYTRPLRLDMNVAFQHVDKVILFSEMQPAAQGVGRLLKRKKVSQPLERIMPGVYEAMLVPWSNDAAKQIVERPVMGDGGFNRASSILRARVGMQLMMGNLINAAQQVSGIPAISAKLEADGLKRSALRKSMVKWVANPAQFSRDVWAQSTYMKDRAENEVAAMSDTMRDILFNPTMLQKGEMFTRRHAYFLQTWMDNRIAPIAWQAGYDAWRAAQPKVNATGMTPEQIAALEARQHRDAVLYADGLVRQTQGSQLPEDVSRFERGIGFVRLFSQFAGYFNMQANTNAASVVKLAEQGGLKKNAGRGFYVLMMGLLAPIWIAEAIGLGMRGGAEDEDEDGAVWDDWLRSVFGMGTFRGLVAMVPVIGQAATAAVNRFNNNPADDRISISPVVSFFESLGSAGYQVVRGATGEEINVQRLLRDVGLAAGTATGLPLFMFARPIGYAAGVAQDRIDPEGLVDATRGLITGTASPESRVP